MKYFFIFGLSLLFLLSGCKTKEIKDKENTVAQVGDITLNKSDLMKRYQFSREFAQSKEVNVEELKKFIDKYFVSNFLLVNEILSEGIEKDSAVASNLQRIKRRAMTGMNGPLYQAVMSKTVTVTDDEIQDLYNRNKYAVKIAYIRLSSKHVADSLYNVLRKGGDFGKAAQKHSLDMYSYDKGGVIRNYLLPGTLDPAFDNVIFKLRKGQVSKPIYVAGWYNLVKILDRKKIEAKPFDQVKEELRKRVERFKLNMVRNHYIDSLFIRYNFKVNKELFADIKKAFVPMDRIGSLNPDEIPRERLGMQLASFDGGGVTLGEFVEAYNSSPGASRVPLRYDDEIESHIRNVSTEYLMFHDAEEKGLTENKQYQTLYQNMRLQYLEREALKRLINDKIEITDEELAAYYDQHKEEWKNQPFEQVKRLVQNRLMAKRAADQKEKVTQKLRGKYSVLYNDQLLASVVETMNQMKKSSRRPPTFNR